MDFFSSKTILPRFNFPESPDNSPNSPNKVQQKFHATWSVCVADFLSRVCSMTKCRHENLHTHITESRLFVFESIASVCTHLAECGFVMKSWATFAMSTCTNFKVERAIDPKQIKMVKNCKRIQISIIPPTK